MKDQVKSLYLQGMWPLHLLPSTWYNKYLLWEEYRSDAHAIANISTPAGEIGAPQENGNILLP